MDLGIYPLNAIRHITGEEPTAFTAILSTRDQSGRFAEVGQSMEWTNEVPLRHHRLLRLFVWPERPKLSEHQRRERILRDGTGVPL
jgi:hypothetical protein